MRTITLQQIIDGDLPDDLTGVRWPDGWTETRDDITDPSYVSTVSGTDYPDEPGEVLTGEASSDLQADLERHETPAGFVGVTEAARITGLSPESIRTYVRRGTIVAPLDIDGSTALVWRRSDIEEWAATPRSPGRPRSI